MTSGNNDKVRYEGTVYDGRDITTRVMTRGQLARMRDHPYDHVLSKALGIWAHTTSQGERIRHELADWPGLGDTGIRIIQAVQLNPGEFLAPEEIAALTGCDTLRNGNALSARLKAIREAHRESFRTPHFFLTRRAGGFAIAWNPAKTWMWLEKVLPPHINQPHNIDSGTGGEQWLRSGSRQ